MATFNTAAKNTAMDLFASTYAAANLVIYEGATVLVTHTLAGFDESSGEGIVTASPVADALFAASTETVATSAKLIAGSNEITLTVGLSGAEVNMASLQAVQGGNSKINSVTLSSLA